MSQELTQYDEREIANIEARFRPKLPKGKTQYDVLVRRYSIEAYLAVLDAISRHSVYVGSDNKASTSKKGMAIMINKKIKAIFGESVDNISDKTKLFALTAMRQAIVAQMNIGEQLLLPRKVIKQNIDEAIKNIWKSFRLQ